MAQPQPGKRFVRHRNRSPVRSSRRRQMMMSSRSHGPHQSQMSMLMDNPVNQAAFWSQETHFLTDLVAKNPKPLPLIVRCTSRLLPGEEIPVNINVPMLLCAGRSSKKLLAKHVGMEARGHKLRETEDSIVIPNDYQGNFLRLQARTTKDQSVMKTLAQIAESNAPAFLTLSPITVFYRIEHKEPINATNAANATNGHKPVENGTSVTSAETSRLGSKLSTSSHRTTVSQKRVVMPPGSVFLIQGISKGFAKTKKKSREIPLLTCSDPNGRVCLISGDQPGEFVESEAPNQDSTSTVLSKKSNELMDANRYPSLVRFVYGDNMPRLTPCSYLFTLVDTFTEDSLIGCLLYPKHAIMIELPVNSSLRFQVALNTEELLTLQLPLHARNQVLNRREGFMTDLKLKCKFLHQVSRGEGIDIMDEMSSATVRTRQHANEAFFYL